MYSQTENFWWRITYVSICRRHNLLFFSRCPKRIILFIFFSHTFQPIALIFCLKINYDKTMVVWIGSQRNRNIKSMPELNFKLESCFFHNLGCCVSTNVLDVVLINHEDNLHEIRKLLNTWSRRNTTPFGTIVLIKTTAISKITHLFMNLPDPDAKFLYDLNLLLYNFLWGGK